MRQPLKLLSLVAFYLQQRPTYYSGPQDLWLATLVNWVERCVWKQFVFLSLSLASIATSVHADQFTATWNGTGYWNSTANWSLSPSAPLGFVSPHNDTPAANDTYVAEMASGTVTLDSGEVTIDALNLKGGNLRIGSLASLTLTSQTRNSTWSGGVIGSIGRTNGGTLNIASGVTLTVTSRNVSGPDLFVHNSGTTILTDSARLYPLNWNNNSGAMFALQGGDLGDPLRSTFTNNSNAIFKKTGGAQTSSVLAAFNNGGEVINDTFNGKLNFHRVGTYGGTTTITNPAAEVQFIESSVSAQFQDYVTKTINVRGAGQFHLWSGIYSVAADNTLMIGDEMGIAPGRLTLDFQAALEGPGDIQINRLSTFNWIGGSSRSHLGNNTGGQMTIASEAFLNISGRVTLAKTINNNAVVKFPSLGEVVGSLGAEWNNNAGSVFQLQHHSHLWDDRDSAGVSVFNNNRGATFLVSDGSSAVQWEFNNRGTVYIDLNSSVSFSNGLINDGAIGMDLDTYLFASELNSTGRISGNGSIHASTFLNGGNISPGNSVGELTIVRDLTCDDNSSFSFEIGGTTQADSDLGSAGIGAGHYDFLNIRGALALGPASPVLDVTLIEGFVPSPGDKFWIIDSRNLLSDLDIFMSLPDGSTVRTSDGLGSFVIHYNQDPTGANSGAVMLDGFRLSVPEPSSMALAVSLVLSVVCRSRLDK